MLSPQSLFHAAINHGVILSMAVVCSSSMACPSRSNFRRTALTYLILGSLMGSNTARRLEIVECQWICNDGASQYLRHFDQWNHAKNIHCFFDSCVRWNACEQNLASAYSKTRVDQVIRFLLSLHMVQVVLSHFVLASLREQTPHPTHLFRFLPLTELQNFVNLPHSSLCGGHQ